MKIIRNVLQCLRFLLNPKGRLMENATEKESEEMGICFDNR